MKHNVATFVALPPTVLCTLDIYEYNALLPSHINFLQWNVTNNPFPFMPSF
jgi:hypothetical protein